MSTLHLAAIAALAIGALSGSPDIRAQSPTPLPIRVVDAKWLADHLRDRDLVVLQVEMEAKPDAPRIPGARVIGYRALTVNRDGLTTELPTPDSLAALFGGLGISDSTLVVVATSHEPPMAARAVMTLDWLGHQKLAFLTGGVASWERDGRKLVREAPTVARATFTPRVRSDVVVGADFITARQGKGLALIDTRTDGEYTGTGDRHGMPSDGHPKGAQQLQWEQLFSDADHRVLLEPTALRKLYTDRMTAGDTLVTYCWIGYRASMTYVAARTLGLPVRFYDGSYQDWQKRALPVEKGR